MSFGERDERAAEKRDELVAVIGGFTALDSIAFREARARAERLFKDFVPEPTESHRVLLVDESGFKFTAQATTPASWIGPWPNTVEAAPSDLGVEPPPQARRARYPLLAQALAEGRITGAGRPDLTKRHLRAVEPEGSVSESDQIAFGRGGAAPETLARRSRLD